MHFSSTSTVTLFFQRLLGEPNRFTVGAQGNAPRTSSIMAQDYLRPAALKAGILAPEDQRRFGFHNLRHSLASYLVTQTKTDVKTEQSRPTMCATTTRTGPIWGLRRIRRRGDQSSAVLQVLAGSPLVRGSVACTIVTRLQHKETIWLGLDRVPYLSDAACRHLVCALG